MRTPRNVIGLVCATAAGAGLFITGQFVVVGSLPTPVLTQADGEHLSLARSTPPAAIPAATAARLYDQLPVVFEPNRGQVSHRAAFVARGHGYTVGLDRDGARVVLDGPDSGPRAAVSLSLVGSASTGEMVGLDQQAGRSHYFRGPDAKVGVTNVPHFARVAVRGAYPGIDVEYYGRQGHLEYDFVVAPGADPDQIRLRFAGQDSLAVDQAGDLVLRIDDHEVRQPRPIVYQLPGHDPVEGAFTVHADGEVGFIVGDRDPARTLVIDPTIVFGSYLGGTGNDTVRGVAVDTQGAIYLTGTTTSTDLPAVSAYQPANAGGSFGPQDAFVTKLTPDGTAIVYSTYLGGTGNDEGRGIAVDGTGSAYVVGIAGTAFPHSGAFSTSCSSDGFVTKLAPAGNALGYSVCVGTGGTDYVNAVSIDGLNIAHVTGLWGGSDVLVGAVNATGTAWVYQTVLSGSSSDEGYGIASDAAGTVCVTGQTWSTNFPVSGALQPSSGGSAYDAFAAKYTAAGGLVFATYLGGNSLDTGNGAAIDAAGNCYVTGSTLSSTFPTANAAQATPGGGNNGFVTAYNPTGSAYLYSTYLGGDSGDSGQAIAVTASGLAHVVGQSSSTNFPSQSGPKPDAGSLRLSLDAAITFGTQASFANLSIQALAVDPTDANTLYAGTTNGIYKSVTQGGSWTRADAGLTYTNVVALAIDPAAPCTIYAGIDTGLTNIPLGGGSYLVQNTAAMLAASVDCGVNWGVIAGSPSGRATRSLSISPGSPAARWAAIEVNAVSGGFSTTQHRVVRTLSGTSDFSFTFEDFNYVVAADPTNPCAAYAGGFSGLVQKNATCGTPSWSPIGSALTGGVRALAPHPSISNQILAGTTAGRIYRWDGSGSWALVATIPGSVGSIVHDLGNPSIVYAAGSAGRVYRSVDAGLVWAPAALIGPSVSQLATTPAGSQVVFAGTENNSEAFHVRLSPAGGILDSTWIGGHGADSATAVTLDPSGDAVVVGTTSAVDFPAVSTAARPAAAGGTDSFVVRVNAAPNAMQNGSFANGVAGWGTFALPNASGMTSNVTNGVFQFYRTGTQAVVLQGTGVPLPSNTPLTAQFALGNTDSVRKRISVLVHDADFSDLHVCTFWLPAGAPLRPFTIRTHTTKAWGNASISFYAATAGSGGFYQIDDVVMLTGTGPSAETACVDPWTPGSPGGAASPALLTNGDFSAGLPPWASFGQITGAVNGGVFEFIKNAGTPAGVLLQATGQTVAANEILTATFELGNSSAVRKRVTVIIHDNDFSDLSACTFWIAPGQPLSTYTYRTYATEAWTNATLSVYPATTGSDQWIRLDNVSLQRTPGGSLTGTLCVEPGGVVPDGLPPAPARPPAPSSGGSPIADDGFGVIWSGQGFVGSGGTDGFREWMAVADGPVRHVLELADRIDVGGGAGAHLSFRSWLTAVQARATIEVSTDGASWETLLLLDTSDTWTPVDIDLSAFVGTRVALRFVLDVPVRGDDTSGAWRIAEIQLTPGAPEVGLGVDADR